jgi:hypothetical protein
MMKDALIVFFRTPLRGRVKTRIARILGDDFTLALYRTFLADLAALSRQVPAQTVAVYDDPEGKAPEAFSDKPCFLQRGGDIGGKMFNALSDVLAMSFERAVLIGSDLPDLPARHIQAAFEKLAEAQVVLGPATDGGYYLIGCRKESLRASLFSGIDWRGASVCAETIRRVEEAGLEAALIEPWPDIDTCEDLKQFYLRHQNEEDSFHTMQYLKTQEAKNALRL